MAKAGDFCSGNRIYHTGTSENTLGMRWVGVMLSITLGRKNSKMHFPSENSF